MYLALAGRRPVGLADRNVAPLRAYRPLSIVSSLISPRQFIERRLVASFPITIFWQGHICPRPRRLETDSRLPRNSTSAD
jgi:hypothetical protein